MNSLVNRYQIPILLLLVSVFVLLQSPFAPFANKVAYTDQGIFVYCAKQILNGHLMYKDIFDHKGPIMYLLNIIGLVIFDGNLTGIWVVELASLTVSALFMYKAANLFVSRFIALLSTCYALLTLTSVLLTGDFSQEFALPFISISIFLLCKYFKQQKYLSVTEIIIIFICFTFTILLLPTYTTAWVGFGLIIFCDLLREKKFKNIIYLVLLFITVVICIVSPFAVYAINNNILSEAVNCIWSFNRAYSNTSLVSIAKCVYFSCFYIDKAYSFLIMLFYILYLLTRYDIIENKIVHLAICTSLIFTMVIGCGLSGRPSKHYSIIYIPLISIISAFVFDFIQRKTKIHNLLLTAIVLILLWRVVILQIYYSIPVYKENTYINNIVDVIQKNSKMLDKIAIVGDNSKLYYMTERDSFSKYNFTYPITDVPGYGKDLLKEYCNDLNNKKPKLILINTLEYPKIPDCINDSLNNNYNKVKYVNTITETVNNEPTLDMQSTNPPLDIYVLK